MNDKSHTDQAETLARLLMRAVFNSLDELGRTPSTRETFACALITLVQQAKRLGLQDEEVIDFVLKALVVEALESGVTMSALQAAVADQIETAWLAAELSGPAPQIVGRA